VIEHDLYYDVDVIDVGELDGKNIWVIVGNELGCFSFLIFGND